MMLQFMIECFGVAAAVGAGFTTGAMLVCKIYDWPRATITIVDRPRGEA